MVDSLFTVCPAAPASVAQFFAMRQAKQGMTPVRIDSNEPFSRIEAGNWGNRSYGLASHEAARLKISPLKANRSGAGWGGKKPPEGFTPLGS
jgi:hypothetical protein